MNVREVIEEKGLKSTGDPTLDVFALVIAFSEVNTYGPTTIELAEGLTLLPGSGVTFPSPGNVGTYLDRLERRGLLERPEPQGSKRVGARIRVIGARWMYEGPAITEFLPKETPAE